jgi:hypothetical protein
MFADYCGIGMFLLCGRNKIAFNLIFKYLSKLINNEEFDMACWLFYLVPCTVIRKFLAAGEFLYLEINRSLVSRNSKFYSPFLGRIYRATSIKFWLLVLR